jgi:hypothetical protein
VQTLSDLGLVGLAVTLALLAAWLACAARATLPLDRRLELRRKPARVLGLRVALPRAVGWQRVRAPYTPERIGLLSMLCIVVVFGVHSFADWTWYVPGNACVALLCAGWLAGRGPLRARAAGPEGAAAAELQDTLVLRSAQRSTQARGGGGSPSGRLLPPSLLGRVRSQPRALALAALAVAIAVVGAWTQWQPQRSVEASEEALALLGRSPAAARAAAQSAVDRDPLSAQARFTLAAVQRASGQRALGRTTLQEAVRLQPSNPQTWLELGLYDRATQPRAAVTELRAAVYLDPRSIPIQNAYVEALRTAPPTPSAATRPTPSAATRPTPNAARRPAASGASVARARSAASPQPALRTGREPRSQRARGALRAALRRCQAARARSRSRPAAC